MGVLRVAAVWLLIAGASAEAIGEDCRRDLITVEGQAEVAVKPDQVRLVIVAEQRGGTLPEAEVPVRAATDAVLGVARKHGVADADIDTSDYTVQPIYQWSSGKRLGKRLGYHARRTIAIRLRDVSRLGALLSDVSESCAVSVSSIEPEASETRNRRDEARLLAVRAAREKAQAVVAALGQSLGRAVTIEVDGASSCCGAPEERPYAVAAASNIVSGEEGGPSFSLGTIKLTAKVRVSFELK